MKLRRVNGCMIADHTDTDHKAKYEYKQRIGSIMWPRIKILVNNHNIIKQKNLKIFYTRNLESRN